MAVGTGSTHGRWCDPRTADPLLGRRAALGPAAGALVLLALLLAVYGGSLTGGFVLDDRPYVIENPLVVSGNGLPRLWLRAEGDDYWPLTYSAFWLQWRLWGPHPPGYHCVTLAVHGLNCLLVWRLLHRLAIPGGFLAALIFAVHPVNVEAVAWIFQLKTTLSLALMLIALVWFAEADAAEGDDGRLRVRSRLAFALSLLAKTATIAMPPIFPAIAWWRRGVIRRADVLEAMPYAVISLAAGGVALWQRWASVVPVDPARDDSPVSRAVVAGWAVAFYLAKALWPAGLCFVYPRWTLPAGTHWHEYVPLVAVAGAGVVFWRNRDGWGRPWLLAWSWYLLALLPVLGFVTIPYMRHALVADHWQYVAMVAVAGGAAAMVVSLPRPASTIAATVLVAVLAAAARHEAAQYADAERLYRSTLARNPGCAFAENLLGAELAARGLHDEAADHFAAALRTRPDYADAMGNLATAVARLGDRDRAAALYRDAIRLGPTLAEPHFNWAVMLAEERRFGEAIPHYEEAVRLDPRSVAARNNLAAACLETGRCADAVAHLRAADRIAPGDFRTLYNLSLALAGTGDRAGSEAAFARAVSLHPALAAARPLWERKVRSLPSSPAP